jgi:FMN-dependent NADH-azoreductase
MAISRRLTDAFEHAWLAENRSGTVLRRDLATMEIPAVDAAWVAANYTASEARTARQNAALRLSAKLIAELKESDEYVMGLAMHNFGPPSKFKLWVDQIVTPATLLEKPLAGKRATFIIAAGRVYAVGSPDANKNYLMPWLRTVFAGLGASDVHFVMAEGTKRVHCGEIDRASFLASHLEAIGALFSREPKVGEVITR